MSKHSRFLTLVLLTGAAALLAASPSEAQNRGARPGPAFPPNRMPGWDWQRIYPWSPYNYGRNPYNPARYPYVSPYPVYTPYAAPAHVPSTPSYPSPTYGASGSPDHVLVPNPTGRLETPPPNAALIRLSVPDPFAEVWFNGAKTTSSGTSRYYVTPELGGERHHYE